MESTDFKLKYTIDVIKHLNLLLSQDLPIISVKKVRDFHKISAIDRSRINFYWRTLKMLCEKGFIVPYGSSNPVRYEIKKRIDLDDVLKKAKDFFMPKQTTVADFKKKKQSQLLSYYDWERTFKRS